MKLQVKNDNNDWIYIKPLATKPRRLTFVLIDSIDQFLYATEACLTKFYFYNIKTEYCGTISSIPCLMISRDEWELQGCE